MQLYLNKFVVTVAQSKFRTLTVLSTLNHFTTMLVTFGVIQHMDLHL